MSRASARPKLCGVDSEGDRQQEVFRAPAGTAANPVLTPAEMAGIAALGLTHSFRAGEYLFQAGDADIDFFVIEEGEVDVVQEATADSPERVVSRWQDGEFLGELNMLNGQRSLLSARMIQPGLVRRIPLASLRRRMAADHAIADTLLSAFRARRRLLMSTADMTLQIVGVEGSPDAMALRRYVARMELPHRWVDARTEAGRSALQVCGVVEDELPVVITRGGVHRRATPAQLAEALGLSFRARDGAGSRFDLVVIGAGPAGLAAGIYGASEGLSTLVLDELAPGGQATSSSRIENYLGFPDGLSGADLTELAALQALKFGVRFSAPTRVIALSTESDAVRIELDSGDAVHAGAVIVATGAQYRRLPLDRWAEFEGGSIFFAATELEARSCGARPVAVVGGANSAGQAALFLADQGSRVHLIVRGPSVRAEMSAYLVDRVLGHPRIDVLTSTQVTRLHGRSQLDAITVTTAGGGSQRIDAAGLFCFIGAHPGTEWISDAERDDSGFLLTDADIPAVDPAWQALNRRPLPFETSLPRVFAAGDVRHGSMKRVAAAVGEGSSAVASVHRVLARDAVAPSGQK